MGHRVTNNIPVITDGTVDDIIKARKYIKNDIDISNLPLSSDGRYYFKSIELECVKYPCKMKIRQNVDRPDNFSIILVYKDPIIGEAAIIRYNGNHGTHKNRLENEMIRGPHIHKMTEKYQRKTNHPDGYAEAATDYSNLNNALISFLKKVNIKNIKMKNQTSLGDFNA